jgi:hypothetical protein
MGMKVSDFDRSKYLRAADLGPIGTRKRAKIKDVTREEVSNNGKTETKACMRFEPRNDEAWRDKDLLLNLTNLRTAGGKFGDDMDSWAGCVIGLMVVGVKRPDGDLVPGIRLYIPTPKAGCAAPLAGPQPATKKTAPDPQKTAPKPTTPAPSDDDDDRAFDADQELDDAAE